MFNFRYFIWSSLISNFTKSLANITSEKAIQFFSLYQFSQNSDTLEFYYVLYSELQWLLFVHAAFEKWRPAREI